MRLLRAPPPPDLKNLLNPPPRATTTANPTTTSTTPITTLTMVAQKLKIPQTAGTLYRNLFLPPVNRAMRVLDRALLRKTIPLAAADIGGIAEIPRVRRECAKDVLEIPRMKPIIKVPDKDKTRLLLLFRPGIKDNDPDTFSKEMKWFLGQKWMKMLPYDLTLDYDYWTYDEILSAILPEDLPPPRHSYQPIGTLGNISLKPEYLPYRRIIAEVLLSKTPQLKTVVTKPPPGPSTPSPPLEHLAGDPNTSVELREAGCDLKFDYALTTYDHTLTFANKTLLASFNPRQAIAEVSAGVGQLSIQAAKHRYLVYANNPNPHNHAALVSNIPKIPPTPEFIHTFNLPAHTFIRTAIETLHERSKSESTNQIRIQLPHHNKSRPPSSQTWNLPSAFSHFVVPHEAGGLDFLGAFRGVYSGLGIGHREMPMVHVYTHHHSKHPSAAHGDILKRVRECLEFPISAADVEVNLALERKQANLHWVKFRLPVEVALGKVETKKRRVAREEKEKLSEAQGGLGVEESGGSANSNTNKESEGGLQREPEVF